MEISKIEVRIVDGKSLRLKAFAAIEFDNVLRITNLRIIEGPKRMFIAMPSRENSKRCKDCGKKISHRDLFCSGCGKEQAVSLPSVKYKDMVYFVQKDFAVKNEEKILDEYRKVLKNRTVPIVKKS